MIVIEHFTIDGVDFTRTYSDSGKYVIRDGISYVEACDPEELGRVYIEGDDMPEEEITVADKAEAYDIMMGTEAN